jgi:hypothetical protein
MAVDGRPVHVRDDVHLEGGDLVEGAQEVRAIVALASSLATRCRIVGIGLDRYQRVPNLCRPGALPDELARADRP